MFFCTCADPEIFSVGGERVPYFRQIWILGVGGGDLKPPALPPSFRSIHDIFTYEGFFDNFLLLLLKVDMDDYRIHIHIWLRVEWFCNVVQYLPMEGFLTTFFCVSAAVTAGSFTELSVADDAFVSSDIFKWYTEFPLQSLVWWEFSYNLDRGVKTIRKKKNEISLRWIRFISFLSEIF